MGIILKTEKQFRSKEYEVKLSEIFHVPGGLNNKANLHGQSSETTNHEVSHHGEDNGKNVSKPAPVEEIKQSKWTGGTNS